ncbi:Zinc finger protein 821-like 1 [Homarus americanus]|uniref:Zinc finger protein 821-like 1 n=1 Tax=Homarus americanus TaxID=6706 RepID=A0A8J5NCQ3_HOMAM|nr:Zinc finger protein 821-like 1 [Homarus americanus]
MKKNIRVMKENIRVMKTSIMPRKRKSSYANTPHAQKMRLRRQYESCDAREERLSRQRQRQTESRQNETLGEHQERQEQDRFRHIVARRNESEEDRQQRLIADTFRHMVARRNESEEERQQRLIADRNRYQNLRQLCLLLMEIQIKLVVALCFQRPILVVLDTFMRKGPEEVCVGYDDEEDRQHPPYKTYKRDQTKWRLGFNQSGIRQQKTAAAAFHHNEDPEPLQKLQPPPHDDSEQRHHKFRLAAASTHSCHWHANIFIQPGYVGNQADLGTKPSVQKWADSPQDD